MRINRTVLSIALAIVATMILALAALRSRSATRRCQTCGHTYAKVNRYHCPKRTAHAAP